MFKFLMQLHNTNQQKQSIKKILEYKSKSTNKI